MNTGKPASVVLDGNSLSIADVTRVARDGALVELSSSARERMERTNKVVRRIVEKGDTVYGVTTGFGKLSEIAIPRDKLAELQVNLIRSHASGVGSPPAGTLCRADPGSPSCASD